MTSFRIPLLVSAIASASIAFAQAPAKPAPAPAKAGGACSSVKLTTSMGPITLALDREKAPNTVDNFVKYVQSGHYSGTVFHRVIGNFMIQGGGFTADMQQKPTNAPIKLESKSGLKNEPYTVAMARTSNPDSATSQFFINVVDNAMLNYTDDMKPGYAVFGKVSAGQDTVDKIKAVQTATKGMHQNVPEKPVVIEKAECA